MIQWFNDIRIASSLRRVAVALEDANRIAEERLAIERAVYEHQHPTKFKPKPAEFSVADTQSLNAAWRRDHPQYDGNDLPADEGEPS